MRHTPKIEKAIKRATKIHHGQFRRANNEKLPAISHLYSVASIVSKYTEDEDIISAALLHDSIEDTFYSLDEMKTEFGDRVADLVWSLTEGTKLEKMWRPWSKQKSNYFEKLENADLDALLIASADKIHNLMSLIDAHETMGDKFWKHFRKTPEDYKKFFGRAYDLISSRLKHPIVDEFKLVLIQAEPIFSTTKK